MIGRLVYCVCYFSENPRTFPIIIEKRFSETGSRRSGPRGKFPRIPHFGNYRVGRRDSVDTINFKRNGRLHRRTGPPSTPIDKSLRRPTTSSGGSKGTSV